MIADSIQLAKTYHSLSDIEKRKFLNCIDTDKTFLDLVNSINKVHPSILAGNNVLRDEDFPGLSRFKREVNYTGILAGCGAATLRNTWSEIEGEQNVDDIIINLNAHLDAGTFKQKDGYKETINNVLLNGAWLHPPREDVTKKSSGKVLFK